MDRMTRICAAGLMMGALALPGAAFAQSSPAPTSHDHTMPMAMPEPASTTQAATAASPATAALQAANAKMHADMAIAYTGDADVDFVRGMIAHHQGAIDMAKVELSYGTDPQIRTLAEGIIAAQEQEIAEMRKWLAAKGR
ncbi:MAG: hypothetical protein B7X99_19390 [Rhizobiales bacterium 17-65-6]|nr:MAG: hypothetical protein B7X99_19390 [Rhizobiales bacterium 17-65-6]